MNCSIKWLLAASLALNLLLAGIVSGVFMQPPLPPEQSPFRKMEEMLQTVDGERGEALRQTVADAKAASRQDFENMQKVRGELMVLLEAEEFDAEAYEKKLMEMRRLWSSMGKRMGRTIEALATEMTQEERQALSKALEKGKSYQQKPATNTAR